ncbi:hypothetical protein HDV00_012239 [Rhizophlyctis rosea]|nr:hypothetical protein HDV00_012239 [Rhizophlyctis rosea]
MITRKLAIVGASIDGRNGEMETDFGAVDREKEWRAKLQPQIDEVFGSLGGEGEEGEVLDDFVGGGGGDGGETENTEGRRRRCDFSFCGTKTAKKWKAGVLISDEEKGSSNSSIRHFSTSGVGSRSSGRPAMDANAEEDDEAFALPLQEEEMSQKLPSSHRRRFLLMRRTMKHRW